MMCRRYIGKYITNLLALILLPSLLWCQNKKVSNTTYLTQIKAEMNVRQDYVKALSIAKAAAKDYPRNVDFQFLMAKLYLLNKDSVRGERKLTEIITKVPTYKDAYLTAASLYVAKGNEQKALNILDKGLDRYPGEYQMLAKKLDILALTRDYANADKQADRLLRTFPKDSSVLKKYVDYHNEAGNYYLKHGGLDKAFSQFEMALGTSPRNTQAIEGSLSAILLQGNDQNSLAFINQLLAKHPESYELWMKKLGLLQQMRRYPEALESLQQMQKKFPSNGKLSQLSQELPLEAARYYKKMDPYYEYLSVLEKSPANKEALNNVINMAISRNMNQEALVWIDKALRISPNDKDLLAQKQNLLEKGGRYGQAAAIAAKLMYINPSTFTKQTYFDLELKRARDFAVQGLYDSAEVVYQTVLRIEPKQQQAINGFVNLLAEQKQYASAIQQLNRAIGFYPDDINLKIKKGSIFQQNGDFDQAAAVFLKLYETHPQNQIVRAGLEEASLSAARSSMQVMDYDQALILYKRVEQLDPQNKEVLNSLINIQLAGDNDTGNKDALEWINKALGYYPNDQAFMIKKSAVLFKLKAYQDALLINDSLHQRYPYNTTIKGNYSEQLSTAAMHFLKRGDTLSSTAAWIKLRQLNPKDSLALLALININQQQNRFDTALQLSDTALSIYPENTAFLMKKASALESLNRFKEAADVAKNLERINPESHKYSDYAAYLRSKSYHNQLGFSFLNSHFDSLAPANIATIQYSHLGKKMTLTGKLNFAGRAVGTGLQLEVEAYIQHEKKWYSYGNLAIANKVVFPKWRAGYSLFHNFAKSWEAELGARIIDFDSLKSVSGVASLAHYFGDFWTNIKGYASFLSGNQYTALTLTARQYLNEKTDFFYATMGYGNSPDDLSRLYDFNQNLKFTTYSIGAGYQKMFNYRNSISINGTWYNQKIANGWFRNQYDIYITFFRKF